jgi:hypothetical protein
MTNTLITLAVMVGLVALLIFSKDPQKRPLLWSLVVIWGLLCPFVIAVGGGSNPS